MVRVRVNDRELRKILQGIARQFEEADCSFGRHTRGCPSTLSALASPKGIKLSAEDLDKYAAAVAGDEPFELHLRG